MFRRLGLTAEPILFIYCTIYSVNISVLPQLLLNKVCFREHGNATICASLNSNATFERAVQREAAKWTMMYFVCSTVPSLLAVIVCSSLGDLYGRKSVILFIPAVSAAQNLVFLFSAHYTHSRVEYILAGGVLVSFFGDLQGAASYSYAHIADATSHVLDDRTWRMAILESCLFSSNAVGGLIGGYLLQFKGYSAPFLFNIVFNVLMVLYITVAFKNVLFTDYDRLDNAQASPAPSLNLLQHFRRAANAVRSSERQSVIMLLCVVYFLVTCGMWAEQCVTTLYLKNTPFNATPQQIGYYMLISNLVRAVGVILLTQITHRCQVRSDFFLVLIGLLSHTATFLAIALSRTLLVVIAVNAIGLFIPVSMTTLRSMVTKFVPGHHHGAIIGGLMTIDVVTNIIMNFISLGVYYITLDIYSGILFLIIAGLDTLAVLVLCIAYTKR